MYLWGNPGPGSGGRKIPATSEAPVGEGEGVPRLTDTLFTADNRFSGGAYATEQHCGYSQLPRGARDILKILGDEYVCYLSDPQGLMHQETPGAVQKLPPPEYMLLPRGGEQKTVTEYLLGDARLIDRLLEGVPQDEWVIRPLFAEDEQDLLSSLAPDALLRDLPVSK